MSTKVMPVEHVVTASAALAFPSIPQVKRSSRVFRAVSDVYEFYGWERIWTSFLWLILMFLVMFFTYPSESGFYQSKVQALMTSYEPSPGATADMRSVTTFAGGLSHSLGFISAYVSKAVTDGYPEGTVPVTEYDKMLFARLELDFKSNCNPAFRKLGFNCYKDGLDPATGAQIDPGTLEELAGPNGMRQVTLMDRNTTRDQVLAAVAKVIDEDLRFISTYAYEAVLRIGMVNSVKPYYRTCYRVTIGRKDSTTNIGKFREIVTSVTNVPVRSLPLYAAKDDYIRGFYEVLALLFLGMAIWGEVVQFNLCRVWTELHISEEELSGSRRSWKRRMVPFWVFLAQPWNIVDALALINYGAWWIAYMVLVAMSYKLKVRAVESLADYDEMSTFADWRVNHIVWGIFTSVLVGIRVLPGLKTHAGLRIYSKTLRQTWRNLKDLLVFFGYVAALIVVLLLPLFVVTGANPSFEDGNMALLNIGLMAVGNFGYQEYFNNNAPTFGNYKTVFMLVYWFVLLVLFVISQNVLLAMVAAAYDEAREEEGNVEHSYVAICAYRVCWIPYYRWHRWARRKSPYDLLEELVVASRKPDAWWYQHVFVRWALCCLPEAKLLAQVYTDPASEVLYLCSPWAWSRSSPWDTAQMAPWDEQLSYPMYTWADVPTNSPGVRPRLLRLPPLFTSKAGSASESRLPVAYNDADDLFALTEDEVDDLLDCVGAAWERMRRNGVVARLAGLGWSERGRGVLREALLEVYRRHQVDERRTSSVKDCTSKAGSMAYKGETGEAVHIKSSAMLRGQPEPHFNQDLGSDGVGTAARTAPRRNNGGAAVEAAAVAEPAGDSIRAPASGMSSEQHQRGRQLHFFNRRGRIADSLDLLWGEMSEVRAQQAAISARQDHMLAEQAAMRAEQGEIKALLQALLSQQQQMPVASQVGRHTSVADGSGMRDAGFRTLSAQRQVL